jgi:hypothetical protein
MTKICVTVFAFALCMIAASCMDDKELPPQPDLSLFAWPDLDATVAAMPYGTQYLAVQGKLIRRKQFKTGTMGVEFDSTLNEYLPSCAPLPGFLECPYFFRYYIVDSLWLTANPQGKFHHRLELRKVVLSDTIIQDALTYTSLPTSDPSIPRLDCFVDAYVYSSIAIDKKRVLSHDGINYYNVVKVDIIGLWTR